MASINIMQTNLYRLRYKIFTANELRADLHVSAGN